MRIPGLTLVHALQPSPADQTLPQDEAPAKPLHQPQQLDGAPPCTSGDQDIALFTQGTQELAAVSQDEPLPLLQKAEGNPELPFYDRSAHPDALDIALAEESASESKLAASEHETLKNNSPSNAITEIKRQEEEQGDGDDDIDEGYGEHRLYQTHRSRSSSGSESDEPIEESGPIDLTNVTIDPYSPLECLGTVERLLDCLAIVKAQTDGEYRVLTEGSLVLSQARALVGVVGPLTMQIVLTANRSLKHLAPSNYPAM